MITNKELLADLKRELALRRHVYNRRVAEGKMKQADATRQIACTLRAIEIVEPLAAEEAAKQEMGDMFAPKHAPKVNDILVFGEIGHSYSLIVKRVANGVVFAVEMPENDPGRMPREVPAGAIAQAIVYRAL